MLASGNNPRASAATARVAKGCLKVYNFECITDFNVRYARLLIRSDKRDAGGVVLIRECARTTAQPVQSTSVELLTCARASTWRFLNTRRRPESNR